MKGISGIRQNIRVGMDIRNKNPLPSKTDLVSRLYFTYGTASQTVPYGATYCVARVVGAGGGNIVNTATPSTGWFVGGGGGAYARTTFPVQSGESIAVTVGGYNVAAQGSTSSVSFHSVVKAQAEGGLPSNLNDSGLGGSVGVGDQVVAGVAGSTDGSYVYGGAAVGDSSSADCVLAAGNGTIAAASTLTVTTYVAGPRFGGGGIVYYNGSSSSTPLSGAGGLVVLEFFTGDPR